MIFALKKLYLIPIVIKDNKYNKIDVNGHFNNDSSVCSSAVD